MKGIVAYDSVHGNTKQVAEAIAEQIKSEGHKVELIALKDGVRGVVTGDFLFVGSPTRMGRMTPSAKEFVEGLDMDYWRNRPVVAFDTVGPMPKDEEKRKKWLGRVIKSAASKLRDLARERGLGAYPKVLNAAVTGFLGPLAPDALETARDFTREFLASLK